MRHWIGPWLMGTAVIHTVVASVQYWDVIGSIVDGGVFNTVAGDPVIGAVVWSLLFGCVAMIGGFAVNALERAAVPLPKTLGGCLLALAIVGAVLVPVSGFWLLFPAAITILLRRSSCQAAERVTP
jgi:hypothetical protein